MLFSPKMVKYSEYVGESFDRFIIISTVLSNNSSKSLRCNFYPSSIEKKMEEKLDCYYHHYYYCYYLYGLFKAEPCKKKIKNLREV